MTASTSARIAKAPVRSAVNCFGATSRSTSDAMDRIFHTGWSRSTDQIAARSASPTPSGSPSVRATTLEKIPGFWAWGRIPSALESRSQRVMAYPWRGPQLRVSRIRASRVPCSRSRAAGAGKGGLHLEV